MVAGLVALVVIGGLTWKNDARTQDLPDMHERDAVRQQLDQGNGFSPVLPVTLPLGYDYARDYDYETVSDESTQTVRTASWSVFFFPNDGASKDGLPVVVFCVQSPASKDVFCPEDADATHLRRRLGQTTVTIYRASPGRRDMAAWRAVDLTADLDKVTWLR